MKPGPGGCRSFAAPGPLPGGMAFLGLLEAAPRVSMARSMDFDIGTWKDATRAEREAVIDGLGHEHRPGVSALLLGGLIVLTQGTAVVPFVYTVF